MMGKIATMEEFEEARIDYERKALITSLPFSPTDSVYDYGTAIKTLNDMYRNALNRIKELEGQNGVGHG